ncbi:MAG: ATP-dependent DNA helicase [Eubacterium sp.]|nr:ATP-dependent DNA helicase [Eubacterium sp.]
MEGLPVIRVPVRNLVEFILRSGDIDNRISAAARADAMQEGSRIHRKIQKHMGAFYQAEVPLKTEVDTGEYVLLVEGRADGIIQGERVVVDEIKGVYRNLARLSEPVAVHRAQAMCYAYMYASGQGLSQIGVQMTYCNLDTEEIKRFLEEFDFSDLKEWFDGLLARYRKWADFQFAWKHKMTASAAKLTFPYAYREGQKELAQDVYRTILRRKNLFIQAPTGAGKTLSTMYPAVKAVGEGLADKIFYLTAKTVTGTVAKETFSLFIEKGYRAKIVLITAKEKLCLCEEMDCNPVHCVYADGHFDRVNDAVYDLLMKEDFFTREVILEQAKRYRVCPFELCLDAASWSDDVICDYNYVFDPNVYLKRFFAEGQKGNYLFLVDEAHNLVERGRKMYSAEIYKEDFLAVRKRVKGLDKRLEQELSRCNQILLGYKRECDTCKVYEDGISPLVFALMQLLERLDFFLQEGQEITGKKEVTEFYLNLRNFLNIYERVDERYVIYAEHEEDGRFRIRLFCVDPSLNLQKCLDKARAAIFFSATLLPVGYYKEMLSTKEDNYAVYAKTSFSEEQRLLLIGRDVSSRYKRRNEAEFTKIALYIAGITAAKKGNYMVFFPSYQLMGQVYEGFLQVMPKGMQVLLQESGMKEEKREEFLRVFEEERKDTLVAFCVLGGIFGEGIDLKEERLIGAVVVGTGLPQIGNEREILKDYYDRKAGNGFDYAYRYPGMNKVLQAAGRVIRTAADRGVIALLDDRFLESSYLCLFPKEWEKYAVCSCKNAGQKALDFWKKI